MFTFIFNLIANFPSHIEDPVNVRALIFWWQYGANRSFVLELRFFPLWLFLYLWNSHSYYSVVRFVCIFIHTGQNLWFLLLSFICLYKFIFILFENQTNGEMFHLLIHSPSAHNSPGLARQKSRFWSLLLCVLVAVISQISVIVIQILSR